MKSLSALPHLLKLRCRGCPLPGRVKCQAKVKWVGIKGKMSLTSSRIVWSCWANRWTSSIDVAIFAGPSSSRTSSALCRRLGGSPIGRSNASRAAGRFMLLSSLENMFSV